VGPVVEGGPVEQPVDPVVDEGHVAEQPAPQFIVLEQGIYDPAPNFNFRCGVRSNTDRHFESD